MIFHRLVNILSAGLLFALTLRKFLQQSRVDLRSLNRTLSTKSSRLGLFRMFMRDASYYTLWLVAYYSGSRCRMLTAVPSVFGTFVS
jgi:hypothetical protein